MSDTDNGTGDDERGTGDGSGEVDPAAAAVVVGAEPERKPRKQRADAGQPRGPRGGGSGTAKRTAKKGEKVALDLSSLHGMFVGIHALAAMQTNTPELAITNEEGGAFLKAAQDVARHYSVETTQKTLDWIALFGIGLSMYGTRAFAIGARRREERARRAGQGTVVSLHAVAPGAPHAPPPGGSPMPEFVPEHFEEE